MRALLLLLAAAPAACTVHLPRNAPGRIDPRLPPPEGKDFEEPGDPGEVVTVLTAGAYTGVGAGFGGPTWSGAGLASETGVEVGLHWGELSHSHVKPDIFPWWHAWPPRSLGVNVGFSLLETAGDDARMGRVFAEVQERREIGGGWAAGYGFAPDDGTHGPHVTVFYTSLYGRASYQFDRGAEIVFGLVIKPPIVTWIRSR